jgi:hypothetical protein
MEWFVLIVASIILVLGLVSLYRHWHGKTIDNDDMVAGYWYGSKELRRGHARAAVPVTIVSVAVMSFAIIFILKPDVPKGAVDYLFSISLIVAAGLVFLIAFPLYWSIVLINRPRTLVAPAYRNDLGALRERRLRKAGRESASS